MKDIQIVAETTPQPSKWAKFLRFSYVEGGHYTDRVTIRSVGDEPVGENNVQQTEFAWNFRGEQRTSRRFGFPREIRPHEAVTLGETDLLRVKSPGHAWLVIRLWILPGSNEPAIKDGDGKPIVVPLEGRYYFDAEDKQQYFIKTLDPEPDGFLSFWATSQTEVKRTLLILIATLALLANVVISVFRG